MDRAQGERTDKSTVSATTTESLSDTRNQQQQPENRTAHFLHTIMQIFVKTLTVRS